MARSDNQGLIGRKFGKLTVIGISGRKQGRKSYLYAQCSCKESKIIEVRKCSLLSGNTKSCGCLVREKSFGNRTPDKNPREDLTNRRYGKLRVLGLRGRGKHGWEWDCICDCGAECSAPGRYLREGAKKSCGCALRENKSGGRKPDMKPRRDLTGLRFGRLVVLGVHDKQKRGWRWKCQCDCGETKIVYGHTIIDGTTKSCGCLPRENPGIMPKEDRESRIITSALTKYKRQKHSEFLIEPLRFSILVKQRCYYCGGFDVKTDRVTGQEFQVNGLDRKDPNKPYTLENSVPCCKKCNYIKNKLTTEMFKEWIQDIVLKQKTGIARQRLLGGVIRSKFSSVVVQRHESSKKREGDLSLEYLRNAIEEPCEYCGNYYSKTGDGHMVNGIDRVNNSKGYFQNNSVPCCYICNKAKRVHTKEEFLELIHKIYEYWI